jgi:hypothetical protein
MEVENIMRTQMLNDTQLRVYADVTTQIERLNAAVREAVNTGLSIELQRVSRHHDEAGAWGDIMKPALAVKR